MLILHLHINVKVVVQYVETSFFPIFWHFPTISSQPEQILMEIADAVIVRLIYLTNTFRLYSLSYRLTVDFRVKRFIGTGTLVL